MLNINWMFLKFIDQLWLCTHSTHCTDNFNWCVPVNGLKPDGDKLHTYHDPITTNICRILQYAAVGWIVWSTEWKSCYWSVQKSQVRWKCQKI